MAQYYIFDEKDMHTTKNPVPMLSATLFLPLSLREYRTVRAIMTFKKPHFAPMRKSSTETARY